MSFTDDQLHKAYLIRDKRKRQNRVRESMTAIIQREAPYLFEEMRELDVEIHKLEADVPRELR